MLISSSVILKEILKVETLTPIYLISSIFRTRPVVQSMQIPSKVGFETANLPSMYKVFKILRDLK
jgi:hypothetical protein